MPADDEITAWLNRLSNGDQDAARVIWDAYFSKLVSYARRKLENMPRRSFDEEDVALSAIQSFCRGAQAGRFPQLHDRTSLWNLLLTITARKAYAQRRRSLRAKRGGGAVRGESVFVSRDEEDEEVGGIGAVLGREPSPDLANMVLENTQRLLGALPDPLLQQIAQLKLEGYNNEEISAKLGCVRRTVERKLERIREEWTRLGVTEDDG
jgi:DNA-directed RNA polymerase specialized sigma24 family protein